MATDEQAIEAEIVEKGKTAPRITPAHIDAQIISERYVFGREATLTMNENFSDAEAAKTALGCLTICILVLRNGFSVIGHSACASPENFDPVIGCKLAKARARDQIWALEGYQLRTQLAEREAVRARRLPPGPSRPPSQMPVG